MTPTMKYDPIEVAEMFGFLREIGRNRGSRIEAIQHWATGTFGDSWCDEFAVGFVLDICFQGMSPFPWTTEINASTVATLNYARKQGWVVDKPIKGCLVFSVSLGGTPHHIALCSQVEPLNTIAGNTSSDGQSSNGDRVATHEVAPLNKVYVVYPGLAEFYANAVA